ncbi:MAG: hypothetical protein M9962_00760 [Oligoflexia bacterium]|nr:hypothetical protein [Oligoflexia bacterium]
MKKFSLFVLSLYVFINASYADESMDFLWESGKEIRKDCYSITKSLEKCTDGSEACKKLRTNCNRAISETDVIHRGILDSCLRHMEEDGRAKMDSDEPVKPRSLEVSFSRYKTCVEHIKNKNFSISAFEICEIAGSFLGQIQCLDTIANNTYDDQAVNLCLQSTYKSESDGQKCLASIAGKTLPPRDLQKCSKETNPSSCVIQAMGSVQSCETQLAKLSVLVDEFSQSNSSSSLGQLKRALQDVKGFLENGSPASPAISAE